MSGGADAQAGTKRSARPEDHSATLISKASECHVCHTVSGDGSTLIVQSGNMGSINYGSSELIPLASPNTTSYLPTLANGSNLGWAGLSYDGKQAFQNGTNMAASPSNQTTYPSGVYSVGSMPAAAMGTGLPADLEAGTPAYTKDGLHVVFELLGGTVGSFVGDRMHPRLIMMDIDPATGAFSNPQALVDQLAPDDFVDHMGYPTFFPSAGAPTGVVYQKQLVECSDYGWCTQRDNTTAGGAQAGLWWANPPSGMTPSMPLELSMLDGIGASGSYLPPHSQGGTSWDDTKLNYEPSIVPIVVGGYAWAVFTSRRAYGNLATNGPWNSFPGGGTDGYDITQYAQVPTKKLWVAALDVPPTPGQDPSHPAFYLPAQELAAGNSRGFWVLDPCQQDGSSCQSGDQCCTGFCEPNSTGMNVCGKQMSTTMNMGCASTGQLCNAGNPCCNASDMCMGGSCVTCAGTQEACSASTPCCDSTQSCIGGFCAIKPPPVN